MYLATQSTSINDEDDFEFLVSKEAFDELMRRVFDDKVEFGAVLATRIK